MKTPSFLISIALGTLLISSGNESSEQNSKISHEKQTDSTSKITKETTALELSHEDLCLSNLHIKITNNTILYQGTLGNNPIILSFAKKSDELQGKYLYEENGSYFDLSGYQAYGDISLNRYKNDKIRESFTLEDIGDTLIGYWKKEDQSEDILLTRRQWNETELSEFTKIIAEQLSLLDLYLYDAIDFSNLTLDNGTLTLSEFDGGTSGNIEWVDSYQLIETNDNGEIIFVHVNMEIISTWLSMDEIESGMTEEDLEGQNNHRISIELMSHKDGISKELDFISFEGDNHAKFEFLSNYILVEQSKSYHVLKYDSHVSKLKKLK